MLVKGLRLRLQVRPTAQRLTKSPGVRADNIALLPFDTPAAQHGFQQSIAELPVKNGAIEDGLGVRQSLQLRHYRVQLVSQDGFGLFTCGQRKWNGDQVRLTVSVFNVGQQN